MFIEMNIIATISVIYREIQKKIKGIHKGQTIGLYISS